MIKELTKGAIRESAIKELTLRGCKVWKQNNIAVRGRAFIGEEGVPDVIGYVKSTGLWVACEVKTVNDKLSEEQKTFLTDLRKAGGIALTATQNKNGIVQLIEWEIIE